MSSINQSFMGAHANLILNARVQIPPEKLEKIVRTAFIASTQNGISATIRLLSNLIPVRGDVPVRAEIA